MERFLPFGRNDTLTDSGQTRAESFASVRVGAKPFDLTVLETGVMDERKIFCRAVIIVGLLLSWQLAHGASAPIKVTLHIPSKSLSLMPYYFGKDKGFFAAEQIEPQLVMMAPQAVAAVR